MSMQFYVVVTVDIPCIQHYDVCICTCIYVDKCFYLDAIEGIVEIQLPAADQ